MPSKSVECVRTFAAGTPPFSPPSLVLLVVAPLPPLPASTGCVVEAAVLVLLAVELDDTADAPSLVAVALPELLLLSGGPPETVTFVGRGGI